MCEPRQKTHGFVIPSGPFAGDRIDVIAPSGGLRPGGQHTAGAPPIKRQNSTGNKAIATMLAPQVG